MMEGWPSGLRRTPGKCVNGKLFREFKSHPLRQFKFHFRINWCAIKIGTAVTVVKRKNFSFQYFLCCFTLTRL